MANNKDWRYWRFDDGSTTQVRVMAIAEGYAMARRRGCMPFVIEEDRLAKSLTIDDGFGCAWSSWCERCQHATMFVNRPGDARCARCDL